MKTRAAERPRWSGWLTSLRLPDRRWRYRITVATPYTRKGQMMAIDADHRRVLRF
jgi:hypothetical protein